MSADDPPPPTSGEDRPGPGARNLIIGGADPSATEPDTGRVSSVAPDGPDERSSAPTEELTIADEPTMAAGRPTEVLAIGELYEATTEVTAVADPETGSGAGGTRPTTSLFSQPRPVVAGDDDDRGCDALVVAADLAPSPRSDPSSGSSAEPSDPERASGRDLTRSSGIVGIGTLLSRLTGLVRTVMILFALGASHVADAYNLANQTPNMIYDLLLGGILAATLVPVLVGNRERNDDDGNNAVLSVATVALLGITLFGIVAAPVLIGLYNAIAHLSGGPTSAAEQDLAVFWLRLFAPQVLFYGLTTLASALLNTHRRFAAAAFAPVLNNIMMIIVLLVARTIITNGMTAEQVQADTFLVLLLGVGTTLGIVAMALALVPAVVRAHIPLRWNFDVRHPSVREIGKLSGWTVGYVVINQVTLFIIIGLALGAETGAVAAWSYGYQFFQLPYGVFTVSVMTAFTPELASLAERGERQGFNERFLMGFRLVALVLLPATFLFVVFARPVMSLLVRGNFTDADATITATAVAGLAWGMIGFSAYLYVLRAFYALKDTRTPFMINLLENALTLVFAFVLVKGFGISGLAWSWSLAYTISAVVAFVVLRRRIGPFGLATAVATTAPVARMVLAAVVMAIVITLLAIVLPKSGGGAWGTVILGGAVGGGVYVALLFLFKVGEIRDIRRMVLRRG